MGDSEIEYTRGSIVSPEQMEYDLFSDPPKNVVARSSDAVEQTVINKKSNSSKGLRYKLTDDCLGYLVSGIGSCTDDDIVIPNVFNCLPVVGINMGAFLKCTMRSVVIPKSVKSIGIGAFVECANLKSVSIPDTVTLIDFNAFDRCTSLQEITIPGSVSKINSGTFNECVNLSNVVISSGVVSIGQSAFNSCTKLEDIVIPDGVEIIENGAFFKCDALKTIRIPNSVKVIEDVAFACNSLRKITFSGTIAQWRKILNGDNCIVSRHEYAVHCTDGVLRQKW